MSQFRPTLPLFEDRLQGMLRRSESRLGDVAIINGQKVSGFLEISYARPVNLGAARMSKSTRVTKFKFRRCLCVNAKCGDHVFIRNKHYKIADGGLREDACGYYMAYLTDCGECQ